MTDNPCPIEPGQPWEIDLFRPGDARGVADLFLSVYGDGYPVKTYINPDRLTAENRSGRVISSVARTPSGDIVGHNSLFRSAPYTGVYESGAGVVHKNYRGSKRLFSGMISHGLDIGGRRRRVETIFGEPVCNHVISQKVTGKMGLITMAVEMDLMPAEAYSREKSATGRVSTLLDFRTLKPKPHPVYLPAEYEGLLTHLYAAFDDERELRISHGMPPESVTTRIDVEYFDFARVARMAVWEAGADFSEVFGDEEKKVVDQGASVIQAWVNLGQSWSGAIVDLLRATGYFTGGILPRWFDTDGLLMMKIDHRPHWEGMQIQYDRARDIVMRIKTDWEKSMTFNR